MADQDDKRAREYKLLDPELIDLIGVAASQWGALEFYMNAAIWTVAEVPPAYGACLTAQIFTIDGRLRALLSLLKIRRVSQPTIDALNKFAENIRGVSEMRNRIIHDPWGRREIDGATVKIEITANRKLRFEHKQVDLSEVRKSVDLIIDSVVKFIEIRDLIVAEISTLPDIPASELRPIIEGPRR
jgi:hypothetical protein